MSSYMGQNKKYECYMIDNRDSRNRFYITVEAPDVFEAMRIVESQYSNARISCSPREINR